MATDAEKSAIRCVMRTIESPCIVELGARTGEDEEWLRAACGEDPHYIMVEPDMWNAQKILDHPRGLDQNRKLILGVVSEFIGESAFFISESPDGSHTSGSIRRPTGHYDRYPDVQFTGVAHVPFLCGAPQQAGSRRSNRIRTPVRQLALQTGPARATR